MRKTILKSDIFTRTIFKRTMGFMLFSSIGAALADIADALVLGVRLGETGLAAISFVTPIYMLYNVLSLALATGGAICYAKLLGAGNAKEAVRHFNEMLWVAIGIGVATAVLGVFFLPQIAYVLGVTPDAGAVYEATWQYAKIVLMFAPVFFLHSLLLAFVRCDDGAKTASVAFTVGSVIDIILNFVFVFWFDMGVAGAAIATVIGVSVCVLICLWYVVLRKNTILTICKFNFKLHNIISSFKIGLATSVQNAWTIVFFIIINNLLMRLGGTSAVAVFDVTMCVSFLALAIFNAAGETSQPMIATFIGECNPKAVKITMRLSLVWGLLLGIPCIAIMWIFAQQLCQLFGLSPEITSQYGIFAVRCFLAGAAIGGVSIIFMNYFQVVDQEKTAFFISFMRGFALLLPAAFLCARLFGVQGIWFMFPITEALTLAATLIFCLWWQRRYKENEKQAVLTKTWLLDAKENALAPVLQEAEEFAEILGATPKQSIRVVMMIEELCSAIMEEGFINGHGCIQITLLCQNGKDFELHIRDNARSFNIFAAKTRRITSAEDENEDALKSLPLLLIRKNTKTHFYRRYQGFNTLLLTIGE